MNNSNMSRNDLNFEIVQTKTISAPSFKINGITVHSVYDPVSEAQKWAAQVMDRINLEGIPDKIIIFGMGAGYHIKTLIDFLKKDEKEIRIEVVEPAQESIEFIKSNFDILELISKINVTVLDRISENLYLDASAVSQKLELDKSNILFCELPPYKKIFSEEYALIHKLHGINQFFTPSSFKVLLVQPMYGGSSTIGNYLYSALLNLGYDAKILDFSKFYDA